MRTLAKIIATTSPLMKLHKCKFENIELASRQITGCLKQYKWDLRTLIDKHSRTILGPGSEFLEEEVLQSRWECHEYWPKMRQMISSGVDYPLDEMSAEDQKTWNTR